MTNRPSHAALATRFPRFFLWGVASSAFQIEGAFGYSDLSVDAKHRTATFTIANGGTVGGTEIAQVYVELPAKSAEHFRRLAGWQRVYLNAGERRTVTVSMEPLALAVFDEAKDAWAWIPGRYRVSVGASSRNLPLQADARLY